ncbi:MAG: VOC family protein [Alphaproteobacteria bacterium]|jgi:catechol 2,3-dioxygenase-like lactoylglutathione lyase family enzyme
MGVRFLEHILILTDDPDATRDWWMQTVGLVEKPHPDFGFPVHWLGTEDQDIVHIGLRYHSDHQKRYLETPEGSAEADAAERDSGSGRIDHVCFNCEGIEQTLDRLDTAGIEYSERSTEDSPLYQIFLRDPINGIKVELNFPAEEARKAGRKPGWTNRGEAIAA